MSKEVRKALLAIANDYGLSQKKMTDEKCFFTSNEPNDARYQAKGSSESSVAMFDNIRRLSPAVLLASDLSKISLPDDPSNSILYPANFYCFNANELIQHHIFSILGIVASMQRCDSVKEKIDKEVVKKHSEGDQYLNVGNIACALSCYLSAYSAYQQLHPTVCYLEECYLKINLGLLLANTLLETEGGAEIALMYYRAAYNTYTLRFEANTRPSFSDFCHSRLWRSQGANVPSSPKRKGEAEKLLLKVLH